MVLLAGRLRRQALAVVSGGSVTPVTPPVVSPGVPTVTTAPTVSGTAQQGGVLTCSAGAWTNVSDSTIDGTVTTAYQWQTSTTGTSGWANLSGATASTYMCQSSDVGNYLRCQVTVTNVTGAGVADTAATAQVASGAPASTTAPTITGGTTSTPAIDSSTPAATTTPSATNNYSSLTTGSFTPPAGANIVLSFACDWEYATSTGISSITDTQGLTWHKLEQELITSPVYADAEVWISSATANSAMTITVNFADALYSGQTGLALIGPAVITGAAPVASQIGETAGASGASTAPAVTLPALVGANSLLVGVGLARQSASAPSGYGSGESAVWNGHTWTETAVSGMWAVHAAPGAAAGTSETLSATLGASETWIMAAVEILGATTFTEGQTVTATTGSWSNSPTSYAYQWQRSANGTSGWAAISGATSSSYTLGSADGNNYVRCVVTATNTYGSASANTAATSEVIV